MEVADKYNIQSPEQFFGGERPTTLAQPITLDSYANVSRDTLGISSTIKWCPSCRYNSSALIVHADCLALTMKNDLPYWLVTWLLRYLPALQRCRMPTWMPLVSTLTVMALVVTTVVFITACRYFVPWIWGPCWHDSFFRVGFLSWRFLCPFESLEVLFSWYKVSSALSTPRRCRQKVCLIP